MYFAQWKANSKLAQLSLQNFRRGLSDQVLVREGEKPKILYF